MARHGHRRRLAEAPNGYEHNSLDDAVYACNSSPGTPAKGTPNYKPKSNTDAATTSEIPAITTGGTAVQNGYSSVDMPRASFNWARQSSSASCAATRTSRQSATARAAAWRNR